MVSLFKKFIQHFVIIGLLFSVSIFNAEYVQAATTVMWGKTELKKGQIGKVMILKETPLYKIDSDGSLSELRKLAKGDEFRVYSYQAKNGGLFGVGGGGFIQQNVTAVKYETPSKTKLEELSRINRSSTNSFSKPAEKVAGIKTIYGNHTYGSKSQAEYDVVVKKAKEAFATYKEDTELVTYIERYISGERSKGGFDYESQMLESVHNCYESLLLNGVSMADVLKLIKSFTVDSVIREGSKDPLDGSPRSAYDAIVLKTDDCDSTAQSQSLSFDMAGFSTMIVAGNNHADLYVKVNDIWYFYGSGGFDASSKSPTNISAGQYIMSHPTF